MRPEVFGGLLFQVVKLASLSIQSEPFLAWLSVVIVVVVAEDVVHVVEVVEAE